MNFTFLNILMISFLFWCAHLMASGTDFKAYEKAKKEASLKQESCKDAAYTLFRKDKTVWDKLSEKSQEIFLTSFCENQFPLPPTPPECQ